MSDSSCGDPNAVPVSGTGQSHCIPTSIRSYFGGSYTLQQLLQLANDALGGVYVPTGNQPSLSDIDAAIGAFITGFDRCRFVTGFYSNSSSARLASGEGEQKEGIQLDMFPNPAQDNLNLSFNSSESGNIELKLFDMNGRMVKNLYQGFVNQDVVYQMSMYVGDVAKEVYVVQVKCNDMTTNRKLIITK